MKFNTLIAKGIIRMGIGAFALGVGGGDGTAGDLENTLYLDLKDGRVVIELWPDLAPNHVARIKDLARESFYDGIVFHRVIEGFMAQTGDPTGRGTGGSGKKLKAEFTNTPHLRGTVSMARARDPDSADSQFFIVFAPASYLDGEYTIWGPSGERNGISSTKSKKAIHNRERCAILIASCAYRWRQTSLSSTAG